MGRVTVVARGPTVQRPVHSRRHSNASSRHAAASTGPRAWRMQSVNATRHSWQAVVGPCAATVAGLMTTNPTAIATASANAVRKRVIGTSIRETAAPPMHEADHLAKGTRLKAQGSTLNFVFCALDFASWALCLVPWALCLGLCALRLAPRPVEEPRQLNLQHLPRVAQDRRGPPDALP
jgi:hypothetical protein